MTTENYKVGQVLEVSIIKKRFADNPAFRIIGKHGGLTCFIAKNTILAPVWGGTFQAKVLKVCEGSLIVSLIHRIGTWAAPRPYDVHYQDEHGNFMICEEYDEASLPRAYDDNGDRLYS